MLPMLDKKFVSIGAKSNAKKERRQRLNSFLFFLPLFFFFGARSRNIRAASAVLQSLNGYSRVVSPAVNNIEIGSRSGVCLRNEYLPADGYGSFNQSVALLYRSESDQLVCVSQNEPRELFYFLLAHRE